jgi:hypothetical protein
MQRVPPDDEAPLSTDGLTHVVRVGDTVRRPWRDYTATVHAYLAHVRAQGITFVPEPLGRDEQGREVLSFIAGDVPVRPLPDWTTADVVLTDLAQLIRQLHDAASGWTPPVGAAWGRLPESAAPSLDPDDGLVVGHSDYCPGNVVFTGQRPSAFIDFDLVKPTTRVADCVNALHWWAPLIDPRDRPEPLRDADMPRRVRLFADAYGMTVHERSQVADAALTRARQSLTWARAVIARGDEVDPAFARWWEQGWKDQMPRTVAWLEDAAPTLHAALTH